MARHLNAEDVIASIHAFSDCDESDIFEGNYCKNIQWNNYIAIQKLMMLQLELQILILL